MRRSRGRCGQSRIGHCQTEVIRLAGEARTGKLNNTPEREMVSDEVNRWLKLARSRWFIAALCASSAELLGGTLVANALFQGGLGDGRWTMRTLLLLAMTLAMTASAFAQSTAPAAQPSGTAAPTVGMSSCKTQAADKKLAGAAMTSFMKKCEADAAKACTTQAADKKLAGAAKNSFTKKCVGDAVGST
jgi:hypothetical protein